MRNRILLLCVAVALVALAIWQASNWFATSNNADNQTANSTKKRTPNPLDAAHEAEEQASPAVVAELVQTLKHDNASLRVGAAEKLARLASEHRTAAVQVLLNEYQSYEPLVKAGATQAILALRGKITPTLVALVKTVILPTRDKIAEILDRIGPESLPPLVAAYAGSDLVLREFAERELHKWGPNATAELATALESSKFTTERPRLALLLLEMDPASAGVATPHLLALLKEPDGTLRRRALEVVSRIGPRPEQAPVLVALLDEADASVRSQAAIALRQVGPAAVPHLRTLIMDRMATAKARQAAVEILGRSGAAASAAVPDLTAILKGNEVFLHYWAAQALVRVGPAGVAGLMEVVGDRQALAWEAAALQVSRVGPAAKEIAPALAALLPDKGLNRKERELLATALENIGAEAVPALANLAKTAGGPERNLAIQALGRLGPAAVEAGPALGVALRHIPDRVSADAMAALTAIGPDAVPTLREALRDPNAIVRTSAAQALAQIGPTAKDAVPELANSLRAPEDEMRYAAALALAKIGPAAGGATALLCERLGDPTAKVREAAVRALGNIGPAAKEAIPVLVKTMQVEDKILRVQAAGALLRIDPTQAQAVAMLRAALASAEEPAPGVPLRLIAADAVRQLGAGAQEFAAALQPLLMDSHPRVRAWAAAALIGIDAKLAKELVPVLAAGRLDQDVAAALEQLGPRAKQAIPAIRGFFDLNDDAPYTLRLALVKALQAIGPDAAPALLATVKHADVLYRKDPILFDVLQALGSMRPMSPTGAEGLGDLVRNDGEKNANVRVAAVEALGRLGPDAVVALTALRFALKDEDVLLRTRAAEALGRIGPAAKAAAVDLQILAERDSFPHVRGVAAVALKNINAAK